MKKLILSLLIAIVLGAGAASVSAGHGGHGGHMDRVVEKLQLTTEQETQFREIMKAKREQMKSFHQMQRAKAHAQLKEILTDEQLAEFEEMSKHRCPHKGKQ